MQNSRVSHDFLPKTANTTERAVLLIYLIIGVSNPKEIAMLLGHRYTTEVYRCMKKYNDYIINFSCGTGHKNRLLTIFRKG